MLKHIYQKRSRKQSWLIIYAILAVLITMITSMTANVKSVYAETCSQTSLQGWPSPNWSLVNSYVNLRGKSWVCWSGENYRHKAYTYGSQYPGQPLNKIRVSTLTWEETNGSVCSQFWEADSGWKYNTYSKTIYTPSHHYACEGGTSHYYVQLSTHYFGDSTTAQTGTK